MPEPRRLSEWVADSGIETMEKLAFLTGISVEALEKFDQKLATPTRAHLRVLKKYLPTMPEEAVLGHERVKPVGLKMSGRALPPQGYKMMVVPVAEMRPGDLLAIQREVKGAWWTEVTAVERQSPLIIGIDCGTISLKAHIARSAKIARADERPKDKPAERRDEAAGRPAEASGLGETQRPGGHDGSPSEGPVFGS